MLYIEYVRNNYFTLINYFLSWDISWSKLPFGQIVTLSKMEIHHKLVFNVHKIPFAHFAKIPALLKIPCTFSIKLCRAETGINNQFRATPKIYNMILIQYGMINSYEAI